MSFATCESVMIELLSEANEIISAKENPVERENLLKCCKNIDVILNRTDTIYYDVDIDPISKDITVSVTMEEIEVADPRHEFYYALSRTREFGVEWVDENSFRMDFVYPGIWL